MEQILEKVAVLGGLVYSLVQFAKPVYDQSNHKWNFDAVFAIALGVGVAVFAKVNIFPLAGISFSVPYVGYVLTGFIAGGAVGAGLIHDLPDFLKVLAGRPVK